ncbi:MAG: thiamine-phosphate kinase [Bacteroidia bacterium]|nr:thiamine-phosphate kinase [Bacteroidia bacterium]
MLNENIILRSITSRFCQPAYQCNKVLESDAEIIKIDPFRFLAITTDNIVEELSTGLYHDPYHIGWMTVVVNLSDLAAVGAKPLGLVLNQTFPAGLDEEIIDSVQKGIQEAAYKHDTYILGGDTNNSKVWNMGATAIGILENDNLINRKGAAVSDLIYTTGKAGAGNVFAFNFFFQKQKETYFSPEAKLKEGAFIREWASSCIDTSDGLIPAFCNIMELNNCGVDLTIPVEKIVCTTAIDLAEKSKIPNWIFMAGPHGDYELLFTIRSDKSSDFEEEAKKHGFDFSLIGKCSEGNELSFTSGSYRYKLDPFHISNEFSQCNNNPQLYFESLLQIDQKWKM